MKFKLGDRVVATQNSDIEGRNQIGTVVNANSAHYYISFDTYFPEGWAWRGYRNCWAIAERNLTHAEEYVVDMVLTKYSNE